MAIIADFMLVWLPAPTVSLRPPLAITAGPIAKFFYSCPDNAFQVTICCLRPSLFIKPYIKLVIRIVVCRLLWVEHRIHFYRD